MYVFNLRLETMQQRWHPSLLRAANSYYRLYLTGPHRLLAKPTAKDFSERDKKPVKHYPMLGYGYWPELVVKYMTRVKLAAASWFRRELCFPSGRIVAVQNPVQWAVCDLSRTICSPCAALFTWTAIPMDIYFELWECIPWLLSVSTSDSRGPHHCWEVLHVWHAACQCMSPSDAALITQRCWADKR